MPSHDITTRDLITREMLTRVFGPSPQAAAKSAPETGQASATGIRLPAVDFAPLPAHHLDRRETEVDRRKTEPPAYEPTIKNVCPALVRSASR